MASITPKKILVIRNDKLGDFMLAWPSFQMVRQLFPDSTIYTLVPEYTSPMAELCPWIDEIVLDNDREGLSGIKRTVSKIKSLGIDTALCLHSTPRIALALFLAGVPHRFAPASRIDQILYNHTLTQRRSLSQKPEYQYNTDLARYMGKHHAVNSQFEPEPPFLSFPEQDTQKIKSFFYTEYNIGCNKNLVFVHAGSGGSASNLSIEQYAKLIKLLSANITLYFVLTSGPGEDELVKKLSNQIQDCEHVIYHSRNGLIEFAKLLPIANIFISGSTGTLHLAGALDIPTVAFYPKRRSATSLRWQTLNSADNRLAFTLPDGGISIENTYAEINNKYLTHVL